MKSKFSFICFLFLIAGISFGQYYKVLSSDQNSITFRITPKVLSIDKKNIGAKSYVNIELDNAQYDVADPGMPEYPYLSVNLAVPGETGNTIKILSQNYKLLNGKLPPTPKLEKQNGIYEEVPVENYSVNYVKHDLIEFGDFGLVRGLPVQTLKIYPVQMDQISGKIKLFNQITVRVNFARNSEENYSTSLPENEIKHLKDAVINFEQGKKWIKSKTQRLAKQSNHSLLSSGTWYKFDITEEGIYKIGFSDLSKFGIPADVDPRTIRLFNYGGYQLPWEVDASHPDDMHEIAVYIKGEEDGKFDENDFILFYGRGVDFWEYNSTYREVQRQKHYYSKKNTYFITSGGDQGKRVSVQNSASNSPVYEQSTTLAYRLVEDDRINIIKSGLEYLGDEFSSSNTSNVYITPLSHIVPSSKIKYTVRFANESDHSNQIVIYENDNRVYASYVLGGSGYAVAAAKEAKFSYSGNLDNERSVLRIVYNATDAASKGYLDYIEYEYNQYLKAIDDELLFYSKDTTSSIRYRLSNFSSSAIWCFKISNFDQPVMISPSNISGGEFIFQANEEANNVNKYIAVNESKFKSVGQATKVDNQDIHGDTQGAEYVIVTVKQFEQQAQELANYRENDSWEKLSTKIVFVDEIYNEFSSGILDPTGIRNYLKYAYENWQIKPYYVLFFGDGDYDSYNVEGLNLNFIPTFQTLKSFDEVWSYPTDDYYSRISGNDKKVDLAIGRLNIQSVGDAEVIVGKIKEYEQSADKGLWRNRITLVADDGLTSKGNDGNIHTAQSETLAKSHIPKYFDVNKLYLSAFPTVSTGLGRRKPQVNEEIINAVNNGTLLLNFIGHGNPEVWTHEVVFEKSVSIPQMKNENYFFLTAATCDFGKYDDPTDQSGTEEMVLKYKSGAIGGISAVRPVFSNSNAALAYLFYDYLLGYRDSSFLPRTIGEAYFLLKQTRTNTNDEKFHLFGDPALRLDEPHYKVSVDSVNGVANGTGVQIKALGVVNLNGSVVDNSGNAINSVNGEAIVSVYDSKRSVHLNDINLDVDMQGGLIFRGRTSIENGKFRTSFTVPKDISYENKNGKIVVYLLSDEQDGIGYNDNITVGGTDTSVVNDKKGPSIDIYFDSENNDNAYLVNPDFDLIVKLKDQTGLNTTGTGVGHKLEGILNDDVENPIDLTDYFIGDLDAGGKSGVIKYKFTNLEEGDYKIKIKAWDVFNNFGQSEDYFSVVNNSGLVIRDVYNYPNPFTDFTNFTFQHNLNGPVNVKIKIYTIAGRLIRILEENNITDKFVKVFWDGLDADGNQLANGTYFYKLNISSSDGSLKENILGKLAIIR